MRSRTTPSDAVPPPEADPPLSDRLWSIDDIAAYLNVSRRGVERLKSAGRLPRPTVVIGRLPRYAPAEIIAWAERGGRP
jgi:hypothetical protein